MKKQAIVALLAVLFISILPGCGKSKNKDGEIIGGPVGVPPPVTVPPITGSGGCYDTRSLVNSGLTLGFHGTLQPSSGLKLYATQQVAATLPGGYTNTYYRDTNFGDSVDIAVSGSNAYVQVTLSTTAVGWVNYYSGQICGFYADVSILNPAVTGHAWSGNIGGGTIGVVIPHGAGYSVLQL